MPGRQCATGTMLVLLFVVSGTHGRCRELYEGDGFPGEGFPRPGVSYRLGEGFNGGGGNVTAGLVDGGKAVLMGRPYFINPVTGEEQALFTNKSDPQTSVVDLGPMPWGAPVVFKYQVFSHVYGIDRLGKDTANTFPRCTGPNESGVYNIDDNPSLVDLAIDHQPKPGSTAYFAGPPVVHVYTVSAPGLPQPLADPKGTEFVGGLEVTLSGPGADGAVIRYTTDGSEPTASSAIHTEAIALTATTTLRARAFKQGYDPSPVMTETCTRPAKVEHAYYKDLDADGRIETAAILFDMALAGLPSTVSLKDPIGAGRTLSVPADAIAPLNCTSFRRGSREERDDTADGRGRGGSGRQALERDLEIMPPGARDGVVLHQTA